MSGVEHRIRREIVGGVRGLFNDQGNGEQPVVRSTDALFEPSSPIWRVHGDVTSMMVGGISALLLQMLHPAVLAGVWDHSNFRTDMIGRLRRTARFVALTTYGSRQEALAAIDRVKRVHEGISGTLPDGDTYSAQNPHLLAWVHVTEATSFLGAWQRYGNRQLTISERDKYFDEFAAIAEALGAEPVPHSVAAANQLITTMRPELSATPRMREVANIVLSQRPRNPLAMPVQAVTFQAAVNLLPDWARRMHGLRAHGLSSPLVDAGTLGVARTLRWAFT